MGLSRLGCRVLRSSDSTACEWVAVESFLDADLQDAITARMGHAGQDIAAFVLSSAQGDGAGAPVVHLAFHERGRTGGAGTKAAGERYTLARRFQ